mmetsp:Transcript_19519/g.65872  ORF Transcript_19519/g.65872 Transcript_19519/m.65872 type:complete len:284 (-) Transcript_19519:977-1828(-)
MGLAGRDPHEGPLTGHQAARKGGSAGARARRPGGAVAARRARCGARADGGRRWQGGVRGEGEQKQGRRGGGQRGGRTSGRRGGGRRRGTGGRQGAGGEAEEAAAAGAHCGGLRDWGPGVGAPVLHQVLARRHPEGAVLLQMGAGPARLWRRPVGHRARAGPRRAAAEGGGRRRAGGDCRLAGGGQLLQGDHPLDQPAGRLLRALRRLGRADGWPLADPAAARHLRRQEEAGRRARQGLSDVVRRRRRRHGQAAAARAEPAPGRDGVVCGGRQGAAAGVAARHV